MRYLTLLAVALGALVLSPNVRAEEKAKRAIVVAEDGFPTGSDSPEGAACDLARSFIKMDAEMYKRVTLPPYGGGLTKQVYEESLNDVMATLREEARDGASAGSPAAIDKCFAARRLTKGGPLSYANAAFGFQDVMFVDVFAKLHNGKVALNRTLVIMDQNGKWVANPRPDISPLLSAGLKEESASEKDFTER